MNAPQTEAHALPPPQRHNLPSSPLSAPPSSPSTLTQGQYQSTAPGGQSTEMVKYGEPIPMPPSRQGQAQVQGLHPQEYEINIPRNLPSFPSPYQLMAPPPSPSQQHQSRPPPTSAPSQNWPQQQQSPQQHQQQAYQVTQTQSREVVRYGQHPDRSQDQGYQHSTTTTSQAPTQVREQAQAQAQTPAQGPTSTPKTPSRNFFAVPPSNHTPQVSSSPITGTTSHNTITPNRPTNPQAMTASYPGPSNRIKQSQPTGAGASEVVYKLPPPNGNRVMVKRESKGPSGAFKIPWKSPGPIADVQIGQNGQGNGSTEEKEEEKDQKEQARPQQQEQQQRGSKEKEKGTELRQGQQAAQAQAQNQVSPNKESGAQRRAQAVLQALGAEQQSAVPSPRGGLGQNQEALASTQMLESQNPVLQHRARPHTVTYTESNQRQEPPRGSNIGSRVSSPHHQQQQQEQQVRQNDMNQNMVPHRRQEKQERTQGRVYPQQYRQQQQFTPMPMPMQSGGQSQHPNPNNGIQYEGGSTQPRGPKSQGQREPNAPQSRENDRQYDLEASRQYQPEQPQTQARNQQSANYSHHQSQEVDVFGPHPTGHSSSHQYAEDQQRDGTQYPVHQEQGQDQARTRNDHQGHNQEHPEERTPTQSSRSKSKSKRSRDSKSSPQDPNLYQQGHKRSKHEHQQGSSAPSTSSTADVGMEMEMAPPESSTQVEPEEEVSQFDAFAEIEKYDHVKELQEPWNEMMDEMVPFIDEWAEKYLSTTMDTIYGVYGCFYNMSAKNAESLKQGVKDIQAYQETQNEIRQTLVDFRMGVAQISSRLVGAPGGAAGAGGGGQSRAGTPGGNGSRK